MRPQRHWGIVGAELKRVSSLGRYMSVEGTVSQLSSSGSEWSEQFSSLVRLCEELLPGSLYGKFANKAMFRHEKDFWQTEDSVVRQHVKRMADVRLLKAIRLAEELDIPLIYAATGQSPLHIGDRLRLKGDAKVTPVMNFCRHESGITYQLQLRINGNPTGTLSDHKMAVLGYSPAFFILDSDILLFEEGLSSKLLLPFVGKAVVEIPKKMENEYFRKFILKNVTKAEIEAQGFEIHDIGEQPRPRLMAEHTVDGRHVLSLHFLYGSASYTPDSKSNGQVRLVENSGGEHTSSADGFRFVRQMRDRHKEEALMACLKGVSPSGHIPFTTLQAMIDWLRQYGPQLRRQGFDVVQPSAHPYYIGPLSVEQQDTWHNDWLQTDVTVVVDNGRLRIPFRDLRDTILRGDREYMLPTGELLLIPDEWLKRYGELLLIGTNKGKSFLRHRSQMAQEEQQPSAPAERIAHDRDVAVPSRLEATLRPYQLAGFQWLWRNFEAQTGCCLSDEMGLGKTLQTITLLLAYKEQAKNARTQPQTGFLFSDEEMRGGPTGTPRIPFRVSLIVAPASVVHNWHNELSRFAPSLSVCNYTGDVAKRHDKRSNLPQWDVVLTTYRTLANDIEHLSHIAFGIVVFDESQAFKTATSQIHQAVGALTALHRIALSGTPVENNLMELWSLMDVLNPCLLGDAATFQQSFVMPIARQMEQQRTELLQRLIAPYFLKRTKEQVLGDLPERQDEVVVCPMTEAQTSRYTEELSKARNEYLDPETSESQRSIHILAALQRLRQIANGEGKMNVVFERLELLRSTSHKVLIFSEYVTLLDQIADRMKALGWSYDLLTGQTRERERVITHFQQTADCQFFLISLKAGGVGLNLTAADYVFLLDPWWNKAAEEQAIARAHRIGQHRSVFVYRFVSEGTLDQQILSLQERKQSLIDSVMPFICK